MFDLSFITDPVDNMRKSHMKNCYKHWYDKKIPLSRSFVGKYSYIFIYHLDLVVLLRLTFSFYIIYL